MGASCGRWCAYDGANSEFGDVGSSMSAEPFLTVKVRGQKSVRESILKADQLIHEHSWITHQLVPAFYEVGRALGKGATGIVKQATRKSDGLFCAIKTVPKVNLVSVETFLREASILRKLDHPNVVKCLDTIDDGICLHAVLENCAGGDLFDWFLSLPQYTEQTVAHIIADITGAITHCHQHGVVHRDIKPENILLLRRDHGRAATVKLCDFGCAFQLNLPEGQSVTDSSVLNERQMESLMGSSYYMAPEVIAQEGRYSAAVDLWSLGVVAYLLMSGFPPFDGDSEVSC